MSPETVQALILQKPKLKPHQAKLESMQAGAYCIHRSWGFGQIEAYDPADGKLIIHFEGKPSHRMDPEFCVGTLDVLPAEHILVRRQTEPEKIAGLINENPAELVHQILLTFPNRACSPVELEGQLQRLLGEDAFKRWWGTAKKSIARDHRLGVPVKKGEVYYIRQEELSPEADLLEQFRNNRSARRRIGIAEELHKAAKGKPDVVANLAPVLEGVAAAVRDSNQLTAVERLQGAWVRDDLAALLGEQDTALLTPPIGSLVEDPRLHADFAEKLPAHFQPRLLELIKATHSDPWREITFSLLKVSRGKFTAECINFLLENECEKELADTFHRWQAEQNLRAPVLLWIVKNRSSRKYHKLLHGLIGPRLLASIFFAIDYEALHAASARRIQLAEYLSEDDELIPDLLAAADTEMARDLANQLMLNQGFEDLTKKSLMARFIRIFPSVQQLVSGEGEQRDAALVVSRDSFERRQAELQEIISRKIPENSRAIATAREHGDLRENSEYKMAKQDQSVLLARRAQLENDLARAQITDFTGVTDGTVGIGSTVDLVADGQRQRYIILGAWDSDPDRDIISYKTALGSALLGKKAGETVTVKGAGSDRQWRIEAVARWVDQKSA